MHIAQLPHTWLQGLQIVNCYQVVTKPITESNILGLNLLKLPKLLY